MYEPVMFFHAFATKKQTTAHLTTYLHLTLYIKQFTTFFDTSTLVFFSSQHLHQGVMFNGV